MKFPKSIFLEIRSFISLFITGMAILMANMPLRSLYLRILKFIGGIGLKLFPSIYNEMDKFNEKHSSGERIKERYMDKENFTSFLKTAEKKKWSRNKILSEINPTKDMDNILDIPSEEVFDNMDRNRDVAIQFTGGCDSSLIAMLAARYFNKVHLITFSHSYIGGIKKSQVNADKIISLFEEGKVIHKILDTTEVYKDLVFKNYLRDLMKYKSFVIGIGCLACKLSFDISIIRYALQYNITTVFDGADLSVKTQLSQGNRDILNLRSELFHDNNIEFKHPAVKFKNNAFAMLRLGLELDEKNIMYAEQPECNGNQFLNEIYDRYYFLPKYGLEIHSEKAMEWLENKMSLCHLLVNKKEINI